MRARGMSCKIYRFMLDGDRGRHPLDERGENRWRRNKKRPAKKKASKAKAKAKSTAKKAARNQLEGKLPRR